MSFAFDNVKTATVAVWSLVNLIKIPSKYLDIYISSFQVFFLNKANVFTFSFSPFVLTFYTSGNRKIAITRLGLCASEKTLPLSYKKKTKHGPRWKSWQRLVGNEILQAARGKIWNSDTSWEEKYGSECV